MSGDNVRLTTAEVVSSAKALPAAKASTMAVEEKMEARILS